MNAVVFRLLSIALIFPKYEKNTNQEREILGFKRSTEEIGRVMNEWGPSLSNQMDDDDGFDWGGGLQVLFGFSMTLFDPLFFRLLFS